MNSANHFLPRAPAARSGASPAHCHAELAKARLSRGHVLGGAQSNCGLASTLASRGLVLSCVVNVRGVHMPVHLPVNAPPTTHPRGLAPFLEGHAHIFEVAVASLAGTPCACGGACCGCCLLNPVVASDVLKKCTFARLA
ncbi:MC020 [Molluscum contagiosum virus subtype 1]|nr:MC020 [Molluscum contagiosum virus subtype 1]